MTTWAAQQVNQGKQELVRPRPMLWVSLESTRARRDRRHTKKAYSAAMVITTLATDERTMAAMSSLRRWWCLSTTITPATTPQSKMMNTATRFIRPSQKDECFETKLNWVNWSFKDDTVP